jgi:hypothetical protein
MKNLFAIVIGAALLLGAVPARAADQPIKIGVGVSGPISPQTEVDLENMVGSLPNIKDVPIQPPGDLDACVKRFVAGEPDDRLDGVIIVSLAQDSFHTEHDQNEARFTGTYEIWTINLSTLAEDHHRFTFTEREPIVGTAAAILSIPAQLFVERATGKKLLSSSAWQAYEAVQARVEAKLLAGTKLYLQNAPILDSGPLKPLETAQQLLDRGDSETAMAVFKSVGLQNPEVQRMLEAAQQQIKRAQSENLLGRTLGAMDGGDVAEAHTILAEYEKSDTAAPTQADSINRALAVPADEHRAEAAYANVLQHDVPGLDRPAFIAMVKQMFAEKTGSTPTVLIAGKDAVIADKAAPAALKTDLERYSAALGESARMMSLKCGCDASVSLTATEVGEPLLRARFAPSLSHPQVGLP